MSFIVLLADYLVVNPTWYVNLYILNLYILKRCARFTACLPFDWCKSSSTDSCMVALTSAYCHWPSKTTVPPPEENCMQPVMDRNQQWLTCAAIEGEAACNSMTNPQCTFENALSVCLLAEPLPVIWLNNITCKDLHYSDMWQDLLF